jgi:SAM-dependent methyltransferase
MTPVPDRSTFENAYAGQAPWDIGKPQQAFVDVADRITGSVLDAGCGTGDTALFLAGRGCQVTGIDFLEEPIRRAQRKATERGVQATFLVKDALTLKDWLERFDAVIDSGPFHVLSDEDGNPAGAVAALPGGADDDPAARGHPRGRDSAGACQRGDGLGKAQRVTATPA